MSNNSFKGLKVEANVGTVKIDDRSLFVKGSSEKVTSKIAKFDIPFTEIPKISLVIRYMDTYASDMPKECVTRVDVSAQNITKTQFEVKFRTWNNNTIYDLAIDYTAICHIKTPDTADKFLIGKVNIKSVDFSTYLRDMQNGNIDMIGWAKEYEEWYIEKGENKDEIYIRNLTSSRYLTPNGSALSTSPTKLLASIWILRESTLNVYTLRNKSSNLYLSTSDGLKAENITSFSNGSNVNFNIISIP